MDNEKKLAQCEFEIASPADIFDGMKTLTSRHIKGSGQGIIIPPPGDGPNNPLSWAVQEVTNAAQSLNDQEKDQLCTNAIMNARRALGCLVDWYAERDLGKYCKNRPGSAEQKADFLMRRGVIDELTSRVLERAIGKRNQVEHEFKAPGLETAEDVVELIRRTMAALQDQSDPSLAPWIFGVLLHGGGVREGGPFAEFRGWVEPLFARRQRLGVVGFEVAGPAVQPNDKEGSSLMFCLVRLSP